MQDGHSVRLLTEYVVGVKGPFLATGLNAHFGFFFNGRGFLWEKY